MPECRIAVVALMLTFQNMAAQQSPEQSLPRFDGRAVTLTVPETTKAD